MSGLCLVWRWSNGPLIPSVTTDPIGRRTISEKWFLGKYGERKRAKSYSHNGGPQSSIETTSSKSNGDHWDSKLISIPIFMLMGCVLAPIIISEFKSICMFMVACKAINLERSVVTLPVPVPVY